MKKILLFLAALATATLGLSALNDVKVPQQALASPPTWTDRVVPFESAISTTLASWRSGAGLGTEDSPTFTGLTLSGLTDTRVVLAGTGGLLGGDADLTFSGTRLTATDLTVTGFPTISAGTATRVPFFTTAGLLTDSASLTFNSGTGALSATSFAGALSGNATTATALQTARTISITGDLAYTSPAFDGSANVTAAGTLATVNSNVGTFGSATQASQVTVNAKGLVTAASNVTVTPAVGSITGLGTGVATALAANVGSAGAPVVFNGALGTPSSGTATNLTGTSGITGLGVVNSGSITSGFGAIDVGTDSISGGAISGTTGTFSGVFSFSGASAFPGVLGSDGLAKAYASTTNGLVLYGRGSAVDVLIADRDGNEVLKSTTSSATIGKNLAVTGVTTSTEVGTGTGNGSVVAATATAGGNAGYGWTTGGTQRWTMDLLGSADAESVRIRKLGTGAATPFTVSPTGVSVTGTTTSSGKIASTVGTGNNALQIEAGARFYLDGGGNTWLEESSADNVGLVIGGSLRASFSTSNFSTTNSITTTHANGLVQLGGATTSFPAIRHNGSNEMGVVLADQSAYTAIRATAFNVSSDRRIKKNIKDFSGSGAMIDGLNARTFDIDTTKPMHADGKAGQVGFVAQEVFKVFPQAVSKGDDGTTIKTEWGVDHSQLVPILWAESKALRARVAALEARLAKLENP